MPMGQYKDFADCVVKNKDKRNPQAYCGEIKHKVEGENKSGKMSSKKRMKRYA